MDVRAPNLDPFALVVPVDEIVPVQAMQNAIGMVTTTEPTAPVAPAPVIERPEVVIPTAERLAVASPIGWAAIFGASVLALGAWLVLHLFGVGVGLTALDPDNRNSLRSLGIGVGIWSLVAPILAMFIGGLVAGRVAPTINTVNAAIHGAVMWAVVLVVGLVATTMMIATVARGVASAGGAVVGTAANQISMIGQSAGGLSLSSLGLDTNDLVAPINQRLQERGMPPVRPESVEAAAKDAMRTAVRQGKLDRKTLEQIIAQRTELSPDDASQIADEIERGWKDVQTRASDMADQARHAAVAAADTTGKLLLAMSAMMALGLLAAMGGAVLSVRRERREHVRFPTRTTIPPTTTTTVPPPTTTTAR